MKIELVYQEYDAALQDVESILNKISKILDTHHYESLLNEIVIDVYRSGVLAKKNDNSLKNGQTLYEFIIRLEELKHKIDVEILPYYEMFLISENLTEMIDDSSENNIKEIISNAEKLITLIDKNCDNNDPDLKDIINRAYKVIYKVVLLEEVYGYDKIINIIKNDRNQAIKESIGKLIYKDLVLLEKGNVVRDELANISEGLGYDHLDPSILQEMASTVFEHEKRTYEKRRKKKQEELTSRISGVKCDSDDLTNGIADNKKGIKNVRVEKSLLKGKILSFVLVPIIAIVGGKALGTYFSNKIDEYKTTTRIVNPVTNEVVETISEVYDEKENTYTSTIKIYEPWQKNTTGSGYVRNVKAYVTDPAVTTYDPTQLTEKYHYLEAKDTLDSNDSTTESTILITETIQDKNDSRKSTKYVIPLMIAGGLLGGVLDFLLWYTNLINLDKAMIALNKLNREIREYKLSNEEIKKRMESLKAEAIALKSDCEVAKDTYHYQEDEFSYQTLDTIKGLR